MVKLGEFGAYWRNNYGILDNHLGWGAWSVPEPGRRFPRAIGYELVKYLETARPKVIVEGGCGLSTVLLAGYAARHGAKVVSLEHNPQYLLRVLEMLTSMGLEKVVDLNLATLGGKQWYFSEQEVLPDNIDFALVNQSTYDAWGINGAMARIKAHVNPANWEIWFSNTRILEQELQFQKWIKEFPISYRIYPLPENLAIVRPQYGHLPMVNGRNIAISIHIDGRPTRMWKMFESINTWAMGLFTAAHVTMLFNYYDQATVEELEGIDWINVLDVNRGSLLPAGAAHSRLFTKVPYNIPYHLHLENGYLIGTSFSDWLKPALAILDNPEVGQVRLLHRGVPVSRYRRTDGKEIRWDHENLDILIGNANYTDTPALIRREDLLKMWPADDWSIAARRFEWLVAQSNPGVFHR